VTVVEVDPETGFVKLLRYLVVEDCGKIINPMIVDGQVHGGVTQGIGGALFEELVYDQQGQLLNTSFMDYLIPTATDVPAYEVHHIETPSPLTVGGMKGMGEGGAIAPGPAIANAVCDALRPFGVRVTRLPLTPERVKSLIAGREA
jgi:carbon-monoxide dehydrogenase large subunit